MQTPHSGYHGSGRPSPFFEGWYYRLTLPAVRETIAFMYSIQDPNRAQALGGTVQANAQAKTSAMGGAVQILGPGEQYFCRSLPDVTRFWAWRDRLGHGQSRASKTPVDEGYQATATQHEGCFWDVRLQQSIRWHYTIEPIYGWGPPESPQQATAGWLSHLQIFEPGWQVLMAHGWATGWLEWGDRRYEFARVPAYAEKNWGGAFPKQWFWIQCNAFAHVLEKTLSGESAFGNKLGDESHTESDTKSGTKSELSVTSAGGLRQVLGWEESVGMVGIHWRGQFYEFGPSKGQVHWKISPWGRWQVWAEQGSYSVELVGQTSESGVWVQVPIANGLAFDCRDTTRGELVIKLWEGRGRSRQLRLSARSQQAGLEVGGEPWKQDNIG